MIDVVLLTRENRSVGFIAEGHAKYAESGEDIVCSAVSAVTQTALLGLIDVVGASCDYRIDESGFIKCMLREDDTEKLKTADTVLRVMYKGLCSIQDNYGKYLRVSEREVTTNV